MIPGAPPMPPFSLSVSQLWLDDGTWFVGAERIGPHHGTRCRERPRSGSAADCPEPAPAALAEERVRVSEASEDLVGAIHVGEVRGPHVPALDRQEAARTDVAD